MNSKPGQQSSANCGSNLTEEEIKKKKLLISEQINQIRKMMIPSKPDAFRPPTAQLKVPPKPKIASNINNPTQKQQKNPPHIQKQTSPEQSIPEQIQKPLPKNQEPLKKAQPEVQAVTQIIQKPQQTPELIEEKKQSPKIAVSSPKTPEKQKTLKRPLDEIISSEEVRKQTEQLDQQRKIQSNVKSDTQNESTCIEISSNSGEQDSGKDIVVESPRQSVKIVPNGVTKNDERIKEVNFETSTKLLFSNFKLNYVFVNDQILARYRKERRRLQEEGKVFKQSESKVKPNVSYISVPKTIPIQFISERIIKKDWISDESRSLRFWLFRGTPKDLEDTLIETAKHQNAYIESKRLVQIRNLYEWYTLAHLLSSSSNIVIVVEKTKGNVLIRSVYPTKCSSCRTNINQLCLCLIYPFPKKACCEDASRVQVRHQVLCRFSIEYRAVPIKGQNDQNAKKGLVGLVNPQNSCFMNTALQCLASCEPLTDYFLCKEYLKNINYGNHLGTFGEIATRYAEFLKEMHVSSKPCLQPERFKRSLFRWDNKYTRDEQEDSQEFLIQLLDWLKQDLNLNNNRAEYIPEDEDETLSMEQKAQTAWKLHLTRNNSIIEYLMAGLIRSCISCQQCKYQSNRFQTFLTLPLPMSQSQSHTKGPYTFEINVFLVYSNFSRKNQSALIKLQSYKYEDAINQIKKTFALSEESQLIGLSGIKQGSSRIQTASQGSAAIKRTAQNPEAKLIFLEHKKIQLEEQTIEVCFMLKLKSRQNQDFPVNFKRYLYFTRKQKPTASALFKRLLLYFYSVMFKNHQRIQVEDYLKKYLNKQKIPFKIYLANNRAQITLDHPISLENKAEIFVSIENQEDFIIRHLFKALSINKDKTQDQELPEKASKGTKISINNCFEEFERTEVMEDGNSWNCPKCKQKRKALKKMSIYKAPKILILFFKRFESQHDGRYHTMRKIETLVEFPHVLDLKSYVQKQEMPYTNQKCELKYRLFAVANHINLSAGGGQVGHYFAFINHNHNWYRVNDEKISPIGQGEVCTRNAYMLFYTREQAQ